VGDAGQGDLDRLCRLAAAATKARGHELDGWMHTQGEEAIARKAVCRQCGRAVYVRVDLGLAGVAGRALVDACEAADNPPRRR
jgi:hypothetical protein